MGGCGSGTSLFIHSMQVLTHHHPPPSSPPPRTRDYYFPAHFLLAEKDVLLVHQNSISFHRRLLEDEVYVPFS